MNPAESSTPFGLFSSQRERRLWTWALVVVIGIYSTLGLATTLSRELRNRGLLDSAFVLALLLVAASLILFALKVRPRGLEIGVGIGVAAVYLLLMLRMAIPEERSHLIEYSVLAVIVYEALMERRAHGLQVSAAAILAAVGTAAVGTIDELVQALIPSRVFDPIDIGFNTVAAFMAVGASAALRWARRRTA